MKVLIDTHALLWLVTNNDKLSTSARDTFLNSNNDLYVSIASYWEMNIKISLGKLKLSSGWENIIQKEMTHNGIRWLPIEINHCQQITKLPFHHRDPFDRMLIAQAIMEKMAVLSNDLHFPAYPIKVIW